MPIIDNSNFGLSHLMVPEERPLDWPKLSGSNPISPAQAMVLQGLNSTLDKGTIPARQDAETQNQKGLEMLRTYSRKFGGVNRFMMSNSPEKTEFLDFMTSKNKNQMWLQRQDEKLNSIQQYALQKGMLESYQVDKNTLEVPRDEKGNPLTISAGINREFNTGGIDENGNYTDIKTPFMYSPEKLPVELNEMLRILPPAEIFGNTTIKFKDKEIRAGDVPMNTAGYMQIINTDTKNNIEPLKNLAKFTLGLTDDEISVRLDKNGRPIIEAKRIDPSKTALSTDAMAELKNKFTVAQVNAGRINGEWKMKDSEFPSFVLDYMNRFLNTQVTQGKVERVNLDAFDTTPKETRDGSDKSGTSKEGNMYSEGWYRAKAQYEDATVTKLTGQARAIINGKQIDLSQSEPLMGFVNGVYPEGLKEKIKPGDPIEGQTSLLGGYAWHPRTGAWLPTTNSVILEIEGAGIGPARDPRTNETLLTNDGRPITETGFYVTVALDAPKFKDIIIPTSEESTTKILHEKITPWIDTYREKILYLRKEGKTDTNIEDELREDLGFDQQSNKRYAKENPQKYGIIMKDKEIAESLLVDQNDPMNWFLNLEKNVPNYKINKSVQTDALYPSVPSLSQIGNFLIGKTKETTDEPNGFHYNLPSEMPYVNTIMKSIGSLSEAERTLAGFTDWERAPEVMKRAVGRDKGFFRNFAREKDIQTARIFIPYNKYRLSQLGETNTYQNRIQQEEAERLGEKMRTANESQYSNK